MPAEKIRNKGRMELEKPPATTAVEKKVIKKMRGPHRYYASVICSSFHVQDCKYQQLTAFSAILQIQLTISRVVL